jgi:SAM-dependent methyltransferase
MEPLNRAQSDHTRQLVPSQMPACDHPASSRQRLFRARDYISGERFCIERCADCGLAFTTPRPSPDQLTKYYPPAYYGSRGKRFPAAVQYLQRQLYGRRAAAVEKCLGKTGRVLDVGCGPGWLLREFRERGWEVQGTEFSKRSAAHARETLRLPVEVGDLVQLRFADQMFDAVVMWHVLEHVADPQVVVTEVARILKPGGVFLCAVPNFGSLEAHLTTDKWFHLDVPRHLNHFTVPALRNLLAGARLEVSRSGFVALEYDYFSFTQSLLNRLGLRHNLLYNLLRGASAKVLEENAAPAWQKIASLVLAALLGILSVPLTTAAALMRTSATVALYARKS